MQLQGELDNILVWLYVHKDVPEHGESRQYNT